MTSVFTQPVTVSSALLRRWRRSPNSPVAWGDRCANDVTCLGRRASELSGIRPHAASVVRATSYVRNRTFEKPSNSPKAPKCARRCPSRMEAPQK